MSKAFAEGEQAAGKDIPADANPYTPGSPEHQQWADGHESIASADEANQSEGS